jgi:hypothetical protein
VPSLVGAWYPVLRLSGSENIARLRDTNCGSSALLCSFDRPWVVWSAMLAEYGVVDVCVNVF